MVKNTQIRKPRTTNKSTLDKNAEKRTNLSASAAPVNSPEPKDIESSLEQNTTTSESLTNPDAPPLGAGPEEKPEDSPKKKIKSKIVIAHTCPDQRCNFKTTSDEKKCPYDGNNLVLDKKLNH